MNFFQEKSVLKILKSKFFIGAVISLFITGTLILMYFSSIKEYPVFPGKQTFKYELYTDSPAGGNSKIIKQVITDSIINFDYQISNNITNPFVGLTIGPKKGKSINLKHYNQLEIRVKGIEINGVGIALVTHNSIPKHVKNSQEILFYHIFKIPAGINTYKINIDKFEVPDWWGEFNKIEDASTIKPDLKNLEAINVSSAFTPNTGKVQSLEIYSIKFSRNNKPLITLIITLEFVFILLFFTALSIIEKIRINKKMITITYKPIENNNIENSKSDFIDFINKNFDNNQLSLEFISRETGISQRKITIEIQNRFDCNLKTYINRLRMSESKRLLIETDLTIGEITYKVGFNNQTHFNRVFKSEIQISPSEYRNKNKSIEN